MNSENSWILVTGGCGYLGSQLVRELAAIAPVRILDNLQEGRYQALMDLPDSGRYEFIEGDILDPSVLRLALRNVQAVVHLAAIVRTPMSFEHPAWVEQVNHWGTSHLVEACLEMGVTRLIYASSIAVYGPGGPFVESDLCRPVGPYAQSKCRAESAVRTAGDRGLQPTILRFGTIFGLAPSTRFDAVANRFAFLAGTARPITVFGKGDQHRPFIHVKDAASAVLFALSQAEATGRQIYNVVSENPTVLELADMISHLAPHVRLRYAEQDVLTHFSFTAHSDRLNRLGWHPRFSLEDGLSEIIHRFQNFEPHFLPDLQDD